MDSVEAMQQLYDFKMEQMENQTMGYKKKIESLEIKDRLRDQKMEQIENQMMGYKNKLESLESKNQLNDQKVENIETQMKGFQNKYALLENENKKQLGDFRNVKNKISDKSGILTSPSSSTLDETPPSYYGSDDEQCMLIFSINVTLNTASILFKISYFPYCSIVFRHVGFGQFGRFARFTVVYKQKL